MPYMRISVFDPNNRNSSITYWRLEHIGGDPVEMGNFEKTALQTAAQHFSIGGSGFNLEHDKISCNIAALPAGSNLIQAHLGRGTSFRVSREAAVRRVG